MAALDRVLLCEEACLSLKQTAFINSGHFTEVTAHESYRWAASRFQNASVVLFATSFQSFDDVYDEHWDF